MQNTIILFLAISISGVSQNFPSKGWMSYNKPEDAGFPLEAIETIKKKHIEIGGGALMVVYDGAVVLTVGDISRKFMDHSMRKSYLSALFGIYEAKGNIKLTETLATLGIDDIGKLTDKEKSATVADLLSARSGVYQESAYSPRGMKERLPERGTHEHGTYWYYNNWDFNVLGTIFRKKTDIDLFEAFRKEIAVPLGLEDFKLSDTFFRFEEISEHPAYLFRLSARDEARFGLMFMNKGKWNGNQVVPESWVTRSTNAVTSELNEFGTREGYGYLWWTTTIGNVTGFYASGVGGQRIAIFPDRKLVIVQSTNTYDGSKNINDSVIDELVKLILDSQTGAVAKRPRLSSLIVTPYAYPEFTIDMQVAAAYKGDYMHRIFGKMTIAHESNDWKLLTTSGTFRLHLASTNTFVPEDIQTTIHMVRAETAEDKGKIKPMLEADGSLSGIQFFY